eukprot:15327815-Ditylum_brightwellii.AAC.1
MEVLAADERVLNQGRKKEAMNMLRKKYLEGGMKLPERTRQRRTWIPGKQYMWTQLDPACQQWNSGSRNQERCKQSTC